MSVVANVAINVDATKAVQQLKAVDAASKSLDSGLKGSAVGAKGLGAALQAALGPLLAVSTAIATVQKSLSTAFERGAAEQRLKNLTSSTGEYEAALAAAKSAADKFGMSQTDATQAFAEAYGRLNSLGFGLKEVNEVYVGFNNAARAAGVSVEDSNGAFVQLAQGMSAGVLNGENLVTILERMPQLGKLLADSMGVSAGEIKKLGSEGKITTDVIYKALKQSADAAGDLNGKLTEQQKAFNNLGRATDSLLNSIGKLFEPGIVAGAKALAAAAEEIGTFFSMLASKLFPEVKESAEELASVFKKTDDTVINLKNAFKGFLQTAAFIGTLALSLKAVAIGTAAVVAVTKAWAIATAAVGAAKAFIMGLLGNLPALAAGFVAATAASVALGAGLDKIGVEMDEFKRQQAEAEAKAKETVDNYSSMPKKIETAAEANKGLIASTNQVLQNIQGQTAAIDAQIASLDRGASIASARYSAEKAINDLQGQQLERAYGLAKTAQQRLNIAVQIFNNSVQAAKIEYNQALENIKLEQRKIELQVESSKLKLKEIEAEGQLQILKAKGGENEAAKIAEIKKQIEKALGAQNEVITANKAQLTTQREIGKIQKQTAGVQLESKILAAQTAIEAKLTSDNIGLSQANAVKLSTELGNSARSTVALADDTKRVANNAATAATNFISVAQNANSAARAIHNAANAQARLNALRSQGGGGGGGGGTVQVQAAAAGAYWQGGFQAFAKGGVVTKPTLGLIGEGGENEFIIPQSKAAGFAANYLAGARGSSAIPSSGGGGGGSSGGGGSTTISIQTGPVTQMDGQNYVTVADMEKSMQTVVNSLLSNGRTAGGRQFAGIR